jgi:vacuolar-type H+-ATPase subunit F/Vma7
MLTLIVRLGGENEDENDENEDDESQFYTMLSAVLLLCLYVIVTNTIYCIRRRRIRRSFQMANDPFIVTIPNPNQN